MKNVQKTHSGDFTLQLMEKAALSQSSPQLIGPSSLLPLKVDYNDLVKTVRSKRTYLTESAYIC
jgi:hypothetical protein